MTPASRRRFLGALSGSLCVPSPPLARQLAAAIAGPAPRRLVVIVMPNCSQQRDWVPQGGRNVTAGTGDAAAFSLNVAAKPFEAVRPYLTLVDGINIPGTGGELHGSGLIGFVTGHATHTRDEVAVRPSVDQILAAQSPMLAGTRSPCLALSCDTRVDEGFLRLKAISWKGPGPTGAIIGENKPYDTYVRLFGSMAAPGSTDAERRAVLDRARARNASILDFVRGSLDGLRRRVPAEERVRLDQHLEGIRELERALSPGAASPSVSNLDPSGLKTLAANDSRDYAKVLEAFLQIIRLSFQLDLTRIATLMLGTGQSNVDLSLAEPGMPPGKVHAITHENWNANRERLVRITSWFCERIARFVSSLGATADGDGSKLLDNTLVVFFSEVTIINDPHSHKNVPVALFGGSGLGLKGGRCLRYDGRNANDLMVPIVQKLGVPIEAFGKPEFNTKPLSELL